MNPKQFLTWGGVILLLLGIIGFVAPRVGGDALYFDAGENWAHTILGIVALLAARMLSESAQRSLVYLVGIVAIVFAVWGFVARGNPAPNIGVANLENPLDNLVHLAVGIWAFLAARGRSMMAMGT
ncbi:MAG TPA: hypothetical protein VGK88_12620 [bacterium]|jgi:hypothetical protein